MTVTHYLNLVTLLALIINMSNVSNVIESSKRWHNSRVLPRTLLGALSFAPDIDKAVKGESIAFSVNHAALRNLDNLLLVCSAVLHHRFKAPEDPYVRKQIHNKTQSAD